MIPFPNKKYQIIYVDPPWRYHMRKWGKDTIAGSRGNNKTFNYNTMTLNDIKKLPIQNISNENSILFMWATFPALKEAFEVIESWGFEYRTCAFVWVKTNKKNSSLFWGMGNYSRANAEIVLLGIRGAKTKLIKSHSIHSVVIHKIMEHSKKPSIIRNNIVSLCGDLPRIELFARPPENMLFEDESYKGWDVWGNEV